MLKWYCFNSMCSFKVTKSADYILLDPDLFCDFFKIRYGIPFLKQGENISMLVNSRNDISYKIANYKIKNLNTDNDDFNEKVFLINNYNLWINEKSFSEDSPIRAILDFILIKALVLNASDIHFDAIDSSYYEVKFKIDTVLNKFCLLNKDQGDAVLMRLKVISSMDTANKHLPQSSSFYRNFRNNDIDFRFSTHPTFLGERCVIRVLQQKNVLSVDKIGLHEDVLKIAKKVISHPHGLVIFTGPTNSGKTTAIHSIIKEISLSGVNVMTLEDPVEYRIPGIVQTNVSENGLTFLDGMRSILRQDPSVIFLGEIRDDKTAQIAVQAAMTGHKVLTTLHAYSIKGAISRLSDMGVSLKLLAESLLAVFSQRLVRRVIEENGKFFYKGLVLVSDAFYFDEQSRDALRSGIVPDIENNLQKRAFELVENKITTLEEVKRVIG